MFRLSSSIGYITTQMKIFGIAIIYILLGVTTYFALSQFSPSKGSISSEAVPLIGVNDTLLTQHLGIGSTGDEVKILQSALSSVGLISPNNVTSYYGSMTQNAVRSFQKSKGLPESGNIDDVTKEMFNEAYGLNSREYYLKRIATNTHVDPIKQINPTSQNYVDSDPFVNCNVNSNCGGGTKSVKNSECSNSTCCEVGGEWYFYTDKNKCAQDQNSYNNSQYTNTTNYNTNHPTTSTYTYSTTQPQNTPIQNTEPQPTVDNTGARARCIGDANSARDSAITSLREYCRANGYNGSYFDSEKARLESEAANQITYCQSIYP